MKPELLREKSYESVIPLSVALFQSVQRLFQAHAVPVLPLSTDVSQGDFHVTFFYQYCVQKCGFDITGVAVVCVLICQSDENLQRCHRGSQRECFVEVQTVYFGKSPSHESGFVLVH